MVFKKHQTSIKRYANGSFDRTTGPPDVNAFPGGAEDPRFKKFQALDRDGICLPGEQLASPSIMVNKESPINSADLADGTSQTLYKPMPLSYKGPAPSFVDKVVITSNESDHFLVKVYFLKFSVVTLNRFSYAKLADLKLEINLVVDMVRRVFVGSLSIRKICPSVKLAFVQT